MDSTPRAERLLPRAGARLDQAGMGDSRPHAKLTANRRMLLRLALAVLR
jgi:hypothetical protein